jgi:mgtE-like transporter
VVQAVLRFWGQERRAIRQGFLALALCLAVSVSAGTVLGGIEVLLRRLPGLLLLVPAVIGIRGSVFGALGARLGTGMLTGEFQSSFRRRSFVGQNVEAAILLSFATGGAIAVLGWTIAGLTGTRVIGLLELLIISMTGAALSSAVVLLVVLALAREAARRSWDMDAIGTPVISASADLLTIPSLVFGTLLVGNPVADWVLGSLAALVALAAAVVGLNSDMPITRRVVRESLPIISYTAVIGIVAGTVLQARVADLDQAVLVVVPPFNAVCGAIGGILSARLASGLHLGLITPAARPQRAALLEGTVAALFGAVTFVAVGVLADLVSLAVGFDTPGILRMVGVTVVAGTAAVGILLVVAYSAASASYRFGLDPDNVGIPVVTSTMDLVGILCVVAGVAILL